MAEKETKQQKNRARSALMLRFLKGSKRLFFLSMLSAALAALCDMLSPQIIRAAIDNALGGKSAEYPAWVLRGVERLGGFGYLGQHLWIMALAVVVVAAVKVACQYLFRVSNTAASETLVKTMRDTLFSHIEHLPFSWHMKNRTGDIIQRCTSDIDTMKNFVSEQLTNVFRIAILLILSLAFMFSMDVPLTLIAFLPMPVIIAYSLYFHNRFRAGFLDCDENEGKLSTMAQENLTGVRVVRAFGRERFEKDKFEGQNAYYHLYTHDALLCIALTLGLLGVYAALAKVLPKQIGRFFTYTSRNITAFYCIHWVFVRLITNVILYAATGSQLLPVWATMLLSLGIVLVTFLTLRIYKTMRKKEVHVV